MKQDWLQTPLKRVRGLGSAKSGTHHFIVERLTGLALVPLGLWFMTSLLGSLMDGKITSLVLWLESPFSTIFLALFVAFGFMHSRLGVQVIIEDYVHNGKKRLFLLLLNKALHILLGLLTLLAILNLHFTPPVVV